MSVWYSTFTMVGCCCYPYA